MKKKNPIKKLKVVVMLFLILMITEIVFGYAVENESANLSKKNDFYPAVIKIAVVENDDENDKSESEKKIEWKENGEYSSVTKKVSIFNVDSDDENNTEAYIRVTFIPQWYYINDRNEKVNVSSISSYGEGSSKIDGFGDFGELSAITIKEDNTFQMGDVIFKLNDNWKENWFFNDKDGYFYYSLKVMQGEKTSDLLESVSVKTEKLLAVYKDIDLEVQVLADAIQTDKRAVEGSENGDIAGRWQNVKVNDNGKLERKNP